MGQLPASFLLIAFARRIEARIWPFALSGLLGLAGLLALVTTTGMANVVAAAVLGFAAGAAFALALTFPPLMSAPHYVAPLSAAMFAIAYAVTVLTAVVCGFAWDITGSSRYAFVPIAAMAVMSIVLVPGIRFDRSREDGRA